MRQTRGLARGRVWFSLLIFSVAVLMGLAATIGGLQGLVGSETFKPLVRVEQSSDSHVVVTFLGRHVKGPRVPRVPARREDVAAAVKMPAWKRWASGAWAELRGWGREIGRLFEEWHLDGSLSLQEKPAHR